MWVEKYYKYNKNNDHHDCDDGDDDDDDDDDGGDDDDDDDNAITMKMMYGDDVGVWQNLWAICWLQSSNFSYLPLFWADLILTPGGQICISTF